MSIEEFNTLVYEDLAQQLFHVMPTDLDDEHNVRIDELTVVNFIAKHPKLLQHRNLQWFIDNIVNEIK